MASGTAYMRGYDGDFPLSNLEEQAFLAARKPPLFDRQPVPGATYEDLDSDLVAAFLRSVRERDPQGLGRFPDNFGRAVADRSRGNAGPEPDDDHWSHSPDAGRGHGLGAADL